MAGSGKPAQLQFRGQTQSGRGGLNARVLKLHRGSWGDLTMGRGRGACADARKLGGKARGNWEGRPEKTGREGPRKQVFC